MANEAFVVHVQFDKAGLTNYVRFLDEHQAKALAKRIDNAMGKAIRPLAAEIRASELASGIHNRTGRLLKSIRARKLRKRPGEVSAWGAGPSDHKAHLLIQGPEIVTPGGHALGRRAHAFPFVNGPVDAEGHVIQAQLSSDVWASSIRPL